MNEPNVIAPENYLTLLDWRRRIADIYGEVRARLCRDPIGVHTYWRDRRNDLFRTHPQSPLHVDVRAGFPVCAASSTTRGSRSRRRFGHFPKSVSLSTPAP